MCGVPQWLQWQRFQLVHTVRITFFVPIVLLVVGTRGLIYTRELFCELPFLLVVVLVNRWGVFLSNLQRYNPNLQYRYLHLYLKVVLLSQAWRIE